MVLRVNFGLGTRCNGEFDEVLDFREGREEHVPIGDMPNYPLAIIGGHRGNVEQRRPARVQGQPNLHRDRLTRSYSCPSLYFGR